MDIVQNVKNKIPAEYRSRGDEIIFTRDTHKQTTLGRMRWNVSDEHCIRRLRAEIRKNFMSGRCYLFRASDTSWDKFDLKMLKLLDFVRTICVVSDTLIIKAAFPGIDVAVDALLCRSNTRDS